MHCVRKSAAVSVVTTIYPGRTDTAMQQRLHNLGATAGSGKGGDYCAADHMQAASVAKAIRLAVDMPLDATIEDLHIRPSDYPKAKANFLWLISRLTQERAWI